MNKNKGKKFGSKLFLIVPFREARERKGESERGGRERS